MSAPGARPTGAEDEAESAQAVRQMFDSIAPNYDRLNHVLSASVDRLWWWQTARKFKVDLLLIENKASGISLGQELRRLYADEKFGVQFFDPKSQDKFARLVSVQHIFQEGHVCAPETEWAEAVITQVGQFPRSKHDEFVDLTSMGIRYLRDNGLLLRAPEAEAERDSHIIYPGGQRGAALYPC